MFKSIFTRYLSAVAAIIFVSFILLGVILSAVLTNNSMETRDVLMQRTAHSVATNIKTLSAVTEEGELEGLVSKYRTELKENISGVAQMTTSDILIFGCDGKYLLGTRYTSGLSEDVAGDILEGGSKYTISDLDGMLSKKSLNYFYIIVGNHGTADGIILVTTPNITDAGFVSRVIKLFVAISLWVFLAILIGVYIVSERITAPIKKASHAAAQYAMGDFTERIPVTGQDEITTLSQAINNMADSLSKTEENRNTFVANVSHDLRTPMTTIAGFADGILDGTIPPEKQQQCLEVISSETHRLSRLVSSLLEMSRAGKGNINPVRFNLTEKARQALIGLESRIESKHLEIEFNCEEDVFVMADTDSIHQVVYNLTENAVKFCNERGKITINMGKEGKKAFFEIINTGDGIPKEELPLLFERFYKSDRSRGLDKTGMGLGLYIVKTNLASHGEVITVTSEQGKHTTFRFALPLAPQTIATAGLRR